MTNTEIRVSYRACDGFGKTRKFRTLKVIDAHRHALSVDDMARAIDNS